MKLQLFADESVNPDTQNDIKENEGEKVSEKTFTQDELNEIVKDRLSREKAKQEKEIRQLLEQEREEAKRLAELTAEEREKELAEKTVKELEETRAELRKIKLEQDAIDRLNEDGLNIKFKQFLIGQDEESTNENIKVFKEVFDEVVQEKVEERLKGNTPKTSTTQLTNNEDLTMTLSDIANQARII